MTKRDVYIHSASLSFGEDTNGEDIAISIFFSGCSKTPPCEGCQNPDLLERDEKTKGTVERWCAVIDEYSTPIVSGLVFLGGEPLDQEPAALDIARYAKSKGLKTWMYTGRISHTLSKEVLEEFDVIVAGPYVERLKSEGFPGSTNQCIIRKPQEE